MVDILHHYFLCEIMGVIITIVAILVFIIFLLIYEVWHCQQQLKQKQQIDRSQVEELQKEINNLANEKEKILKDTIQQQQELDNLKQGIDNKIELYKDNASNAVSAYQLTLETQYNKLETDYDSRIKILDEQEQEKQQEIDKLEETLNAVARANIREQEKEQQLDFYKLVVSATDLQDIMKLDSIKDTLHNPNILNKLIWTTYFQKEATDLCNRILGTETVCGIYKITDTVTKRVYIGQSSDVSRRWKEHIKCGLGIDSPASNKLYTAMQKDGVWNFTFELLEYCPRDQLNEKEALYIQMYDAYNLGLNTLKGVGIK